MITPPHGESETTQTPLRTDGGEEAASKEKTVLVVDDEEEFARSVALWLDDRWDVVVATDGEEALRKYGPHVDAVLLDRRMPRQSGDKVLEKMRRQNGDARIAMLTALDPDWDIVKMNFDMYLQKPVTREEVIKTVEELLDRAEYARELQALFSLSEKLAELQARYPRSKLEDDERFQKLQTEFERVQEQAQPDVGTLNSNKWAELMQVVEDGGQSHASFEN